MKTKMMVAALALLMTGAASGASEIEVLTDTIWANFAGSRDRCPRFQVIKEAVRAELASSILDNYTGASPSIVKKYDEDPSVFCDKAWRRFGPNGTYKRQMLEAK
jgi:hypothetical protein